MVYRFAFYYSILLILSAYLYLFYVFITSKKVMARIQDNCTYSPRSFFLLEYSTSMINLIQ